MVKERRVRTGRVIILIMIIAITQSCKDENTSSQSEVLLKLFNLKTSNDWVITIPETNAKCKISEVDTDSLHVVKGIYVDGNERGEVVVDYLKITTLNQSSENEQYFMVPFKVSNQGSGIFNYIGMFVLDYEDKTIRQIDSYFLGDRIIIDSLKYNGSDTLQIQLKTHSEQQSFSETPVETKELEVSVNKNGFKTGK
ncbi:hypothetical protein ATE84_4892 [Aquimarina sp. MAR_2010_214]|uniref:hypothetical protein n=1 Tax=Aquimarina sp. MAR_2010_214 TaxID=1250026 RepID=UPI000C70ADFD|nr:hypothetical protein [Aquimarina sp. MAR_2010_214]PKV52765.1 hypothetical protein ATE84_4892 [Aquimarina sp. MAR_2010_214]